MSLPCGRHTVAAIRRDLLESIQCKTVAVAGLQGCALVAGVMGVSQQLVPAGLVAALR